MGLLLGIDVGTSSAKVMLIHPDGQVLALSRRGYSIMAPQPGWAEQDPEGWWLAVSESIREVIATAGVTATNISGVGLSGQMHGLVLVDSAGRALRNAVIWADARSRRETEEIEGFVGTERLYEITGLPTATGFLGPSLLWLARHEPRVYEQAHRALLPKDFVRHKLTNEFVSDYSDASGTLLFDVRRRVWSEEITRTVGFREELLPELLPSSAASGVVSKSAAQITGLPAGIPVAAGGGDQATGAVGIGIVHEGPVASVIGTGGQVVTASTAPVLDPHRRIHTLCHAVEDSWIFMGASLAAGLSLSWFKEKLVDTQAHSKNEEEPVSFESLSLEASDVEPGSDGLIFLPYLAGDRTPHLDPQARGCFIGLTLAHGRPHMVRAIMEGVTFSMNDSLSIFRELGIELSSLLCSGGGARSPLWRQIQADIYGMPVTATVNREHSAFGAALLAGVASNVYRDVREACDGKSSFETVVHPVAENVSLYQRQYAIYRALYPALHRWFERLAEVPT